MMARAKVLAGALAVSLLGVPACDQNREVGRWVTTENTNVRIDWDKVNEAYKHASGPEDFEKRVNEIYAGDEIISVAVHDQDDKSQVVTGFFDKNSNGQVEDGEKVFTIKRELTGEGTAHYQTMGYGPYYGYHSPFIEIASGMVMGSLVASMFTPHYVPMYSRPYVTPATRIGDIQSSRVSYRSSNPARFGPRSQSGRSYGGKAVTNSSSFRAGGRSGGGFFGLSRAGRTVRPERLSS